MQTNVNNSFCLNAIVKCSGLSVLASVALKCLPADQRLKQDRAGGVVFPMSWTPVNFFFVVGQPMILSAESQDALYGAAICAALVPECSGGKCSHRCASCVNAPGQPVLYNGVVGDPPDTDPAVEGHEGHNHVPPPRLGAVGDEIVFSTPTTRCFFFSVSFSFCV